MNEILFFKTFSLVGGMLVITSVGARINKAYETTQEAVLTIGGTFLTLFIVYSLGMTSLPTYWRWPHFPFVSAGALAQPSPCSVSHSNLGNTDKRLVLKVRLSKKRKVFGAEMKTKRQFSFT